MTNLEYVIKIEEYFNSSEYKKLFTDYKLVKVNYISYDPIKCHKNYPIKPNPYIEEDIWMLYNERND